MQMLIYLTPKDEIKTQPYKNHTSVYKAIGENTRAFNIINPSIPLGQPFGNKTMALYTDDEFLINGTEPILNAYASILSLDSDGSYVPVYGNAVLLMNIMKDGEPDARGFEMSMDTDTIGQTEVEMVRDALRHYFNNPDVKSLVKSLHETHDNNMPEPYIEFIEFDDEEIGEPDRE